MNWSEAIPQWQDLVRLRDGRMGPAHVRSGDGDALGRINTGLLVHPLATRQA